jgi:trehalose 2-sulfotransferase
VRGAFPGGDSLHAGALQALAKRSRLYAIFMTPRSGSTWLTELVMNAGGLGVPQEWFNEIWVHMKEPSIGCRPPRLRGVTEINEYVAEIVGEGQGIAGIELSLSQALNLGELIDQPFDPSWFAASFYLRRKNLIAQTISLYRSAVSGVFHSYQDSPEERQVFNAVEFNYSHLLHWLKFLIRCERRFEALFRVYNIRPIPLYYEDIVADPLRALRHIARGIGGPPVTKIPDTSLTVLRDRKSAEWQDRFLKSLPHSMFATLEGRV